MKTKITLLLTFFTSIWCITAQNVNIPDANFKKVLLEQESTIYNNNISKIDTNNDKEIQVSEAEAYTGRINVNNKGIKDLTGIEVFVNLTELLCNDNQLTNLDVSKNTALTSLVCYDNKLSSLDVSKNKMLTTLRCHKNQLSSLDVSKNTALTKLNCNNNQLTSLDVSTNTALTTLHCYNNKLSSLDVSTNTSLTLLDCNSNQLTSLDVSTNTALKSLDCYTNQLSSLDVSKNTALVRVLCDSNQLSSLDVSKNEKILQITCAFNKLTKLNVANGNTAKITDFYAIGNSNLTCIKIDANFTPPTTWQKDAAAKYNTNCGGTTDPIVNIPDANFKSALLAHGRTIEGTNISNIDTNFDNEIQVSEAEVYKGRIYVVTKNIENLTGIEAFINATELNCINNQLTSLDISKNTALTTLYCYNNQITNLNISKNTALTKLYCYNNKLTNLDTSKNIALTELYCGRNKLQSLDTSKNIALTILNCGSNKLQSLDTSKNIALTSLNCLTAELVDLDVSKNTALEFLSCYNNKLTNLDISKNTKLTGLSCGLNLLTNLDVSKNTALIRLICSNNKLTNLNVSKNTNLVDLIPSVNPITSLDISNNTELNNLICRNNELTNLDISKNTKLKRLDCSYNKLTSLDLSKNLDLNDLSFFYNKVTTLDISKNKMLIKLDCSNNELTQLNVANGKNKDFTLFDAKFNSELKCIQHDAGFNPETSNYEWKRDLDANWSDNCQGTTFWNKSFRSDPDWTKADNWTNGVPNKNLVAIIPAGVISHPIIKSDLSNTPISNLTIERNTRLTIDPSGSLVADAVNLVNNGSVIINSNSTNSGTFEATSVTGNNIIYNRYATNKWHLIGAPVGGQDIDAFVANASNALAVNSTTNARAFATYDNTQAQASNYWQYYQTATNPGAMVNAKGYAVKRQNAVFAGTLKFKGTYNAGNVTYTGTGSAKNKFEMISNPYTRYLNLSTFLTSNANNMNPINTALYFWNGTQNRYDVYNSSSTGNGFIAPGQGFFAELASTNGSFTFQTNMTTHNAMRALLRTEPQTAVTVSIAEGKSKKTTQIKYLTNTGKGLDVGYDAGYFDGNQSNVGIYTKLADGTYNNTNFMLQCVGKDTAEETVIPLGIKTDVARTVTFTAEAMNLTDNLKVFLEDTQTGVVIELSSGGSYETTVNAGSGRFFLHTKANASLSTNSASLEGVTIFKQGNNLQVKGVQEASRIALYNLQGKEVLNAKVTSSQSLVALPKLATGMYVVTVSNKKGSISKKIIF